MKHSALAGAVQDNKLKKIASYKELFNHCNDIIRNQPWWTCVSENEFGCLFQGFTPNSIDGLDVLEWIRKKKVPNNEMVTIHIIQPP